MSQDEVTSPGPTPRSSFNLLNIATPLTRSGWDVLRAPARNEARLALLLSCLAGILLITLLFYGFVIPQTPGRMAKPAASLIPQLPLWAWIVSLPIPIPHSGELLAHSLLVSAGVAFGLYVLAVYFSWNRPARAGTLLVVVLAALLFFLIAALALPNVNTDIFNYIMRGRVGAVYHQNMYYVPADRFPMDPIYPYAEHRYTRTGTGKLPAWELIDVFLAWLANDAPITNLFVYRFAFLLFNAANVALIAAILHKLNPQYLLAGLILYAWNPIVAVYGQSKTDTIMVFFLLLAILLLLVGRARFAVVALGLSVLVKLITLPLVPIYWLRELRLGRWRHVVADTLLLVATAVAVYAPFWLGYERPLRQLVQAGNGVADLPGIVLLLGAGAAVLGLLWAGLTQDGSHEQLIHRWAVVTLLVSFYLATLGLSWYLMTLIAIVSLAVDWRLVPPTIGLSFAAFFKNTWESADTGAFQLPELVASPWSLVYLALLGLVVLGTIAVVAKQKAARIP